jgi:GntR family transcriptional regulator
VPLETPRPQFQQIADLLREAIDDGRYAAGSWLPPEPELARIYGVSRATVNNAVAVLRAEGLVQVLRGRGTRVRHIPRIRRAVPARYTAAIRERDGSRGPFDSEIAAMGLQPRSETEVARLAPPGEVARALGLPEGKRNVICRMRKMFANDVPVQISASYIPAVIAEGTPLAEVDSGPGGILSRFADMDLTQVRITESVRVRKPTTTERSLLQLDQSQQVVEIFHTGWTADGRPVEVAVHAVPAGLWILDYECCIAKPA